MSGHGSLTRWRHSVVIDAARCPACQAQPGGPCVSRVRFHAARMIAAMGIAHLERCDECGVDRGEPCRDDDDAIKDTCAGRVSALESRSG